jgi:hypothetical protein
MNASEALNAVRAAGVNIKVEGDDLVLEAAAPPPSAVLEALSYHKVSVVALLRSVTIGRSAEDWRVLFEERIKVFQRDAGPQRDLAEAKALAACIATWLNKNPVTSPAGRCIVCGRGDRPNDVVLPYGTTPPGAAWLHGTCWSIWSRERWDQAGTKAPRRSGLSASELGTAMPIAANAATLRLSPGPTLGPSSA